MAVTQRTLEEDRAMVRIRALGELVVETVDGAVDRAWLSQRPGQLLRYFVCHSDHLVPADEIVEALWPGGSSGVEENVRYVVHLLRRRLEPYRPPRAPSMTVQCVRGAYGLAPSVWIDAHTFEARMRTALATFHKGDSDEVALGQIDHALALFRGEFLADEPYAEWAMMERERFHQLAETALTAAADIAERSRNLRGALEYARRLAAMDRYDSDVQRWVISLCLSCGRRSEAARRFTAFRTRLLRNFGHEPEFTLAEIMSDKRTPPPGGREYGERRARRRLSRAAAP